MAAPDRSLLVARAMEVWDPLLAFEDALKSTISGFMDLDCDSMFPSCNKTICDEFPSQWWSPDANVRLAQGMNWYVPVFMIIGGVLFLIFLYDQSFMHWSRDWEIIWVLLMLTLLVTLPCLFDFLTTGPMFWKSKLGDKMYYQEVQMTGIYIFQAMGVIFCVFSIIQRWIFAMEQKSFYEDLGRQRTKGKPKSAVPAADEIVAELQELVQQCQFRSFIPADETHLTFVLAIIYVFRSSVTLDIGSHVDNPWRMRLFNWGSFFATVFLPLYLFYLNLRLHVSARRIAARVQEMVRSAKKEPTLEARREFFQFILERVNVAALVRFARATLNPLVYEALDVPNHDTCWDRWMWSFGLRNVDITLDPDAPYSPGPGSLHNSRTIAIVIDAIQKQGMISRRRQYLCKLLFLSVKGDQLSKVKYLLDSSGGYENLYRLIYDDIDISGYRDAIIQHMKEEAASVRKDIGGAYGIKLMSDIDDTLYASGGKFPYGCDSCYPHHTIYPGILALYRAIDMAGRSVPRLGEVNVVFLTARPHIYKDVGFGKTRMEFQRLVTDEAAIQKMHELPTLLEGSLLSAAISWICGLCRGRCDWTYVGNRKFEHFVKFQEIYEEYDFVFSGDDGQGDLYAGLKMIEADEERENDKYCSRLRAVLIHEVSKKGPKGRVPLTDEYGEEMDEWEARKVELSRPSISSQRPEERKAPLICYDTAVGATLELVRKGIIKGLGEDVLAYIMEAAKEAFADTQLTQWFVWTTKSDQKSMSEAQEDLARDLRNARDYLVSRKFPSQSLPKVDQVGWPIDRLNPYFENHVRKTRVNLKDTLFFSYSKGKDEDSDGDDSSEDDSLIA